METQKTKQLKLLNHSRGIKLIKNKNDKGLSCDECWNKNSSGDIIGILN